MVKVSNEVSWRKAYLSDKTVYALVKYLLFIILFRRIFTIHGQAPVRYRGNHVDHL